MKLAPADKILLSVIGIILGLLLLVLAIGAVFEAFEEACEKDGGHVG